MSTKGRERLEQLLADRATQGLGREESAELRELLQEHPEWDEEDFALTAAAINLSDVNADEPLPSALRDRIAADAARYFADEASSRTVVEMPRPDARRVAPASPASSTRWQWAGWYVAAAACLALAVFAAWPRLTSPTPEPPSQITAAPSAAELRARLLREAPGSVLTAWTPTDDPGAKTVSGDVVWNSERQQGYMRFAGLPRNDPRRQTYQLWIFDAQQDARYPVDGGVFDVVRDDGEVVVPINAKLEVRRPTLFALTVEKPGGVVVSKRDRLILTAKIQP